MKIEVTQCSMCRHYSKEQYCEVWEQYITNDAFYCACGIKADRKDEPTVSKMEQVETMSCEECKHYVYQLGCTHHGNCAYEPQTETEIAKAIVHKMIDDAVIAEDAYPDLRQKMHDAVDEYEPQTERKD